MKSAYEIAMEKMAKESGPTGTLNDEQRDRVAEIDSTYDARVAAVKLDADTKLAGAASMEEFNQIKAEMAIDIQSLEEKREREKNAVWDES
jgi:hypothetical protein